MQETDLRLGVNGTHQALAYADDVNLIGDDIRTIQRNANILLHACKDIGLIINAGETNSLQMEVGSYRSMMAN